MWRAAFLVALVGCVHSASQVCADGRVCPAEQVCDDAHALCVFPDQLTSCGSGAVDCTVKAGAGECVDGVCILQTCGDHLVTGAEICDGADTQPETGTCVDLEYDYGALACSQICGDDPTPCGRLGWQYVGVPGSGTITGFAADGDVMWAAGGNGVFRRDASGWAFLGYVTPSQVNAEAIWAGGGHVFVVGQVGPARLGYVLHFDGSAWTEQMISTGQVHGVWGRSPTEVYASGDAGMFRFDGAAWTLIQPSQSLENMRAIAGNANLVVATTSSGGVWELAGSGPAVHYDISHSGSLDAVAVVGDQVFVAGQGGFTAFGSNGVFNPLQPMLPARVFSLTARSPTEVYAALDTNPASNLYTLDGKVWAAMASPVEDQPLLAVYATPTEVLAARRPGSVLTYQGAGWVDEPAETRAPSLGLWETNDYAVSAQHGCNLFERGATKASWSTVDVGDTPCCGDKDGLGAFGFAGTDVYVVGSYGLVIHKSAAAYKCQVVPNLKWIWGVWGAAPNDVWAVGADRDNATVDLLHTSDAIVWTDRSNEVAFASALRSIWGTSAHDIFAVGAHGVIAHYDGSAWSQMDSGTTVDLNRVWAAGPGDVFAVGESGTILHYDGTAWSPMVLPAGRTFATNASYVSIHGTSGHDVYAIGQRIVLHYDGAHWSPIRRPDGFDLNEVFATSARVDFVTERGVGSELIGFGQ